MVLNELNPVKLYIDVSAIRHNFEVFRDAAPMCEIMPVLKADAYGGGAMLASEAFKNGGECDIKYAAAADVFEAEKLSAYLPDVRIVILYQPFENAIPDIVRGGYVSAASDIGFISALDNEAAQCNSVAEIHIEIDTGHGRLGISPDNAREFAERVKAFTHIRVTGIFQHYARADGFDEISNNFTAIQTERFDRAIADIEGVLGEVELKHAANSAGVFNPYAKQYNMCRPGYMLYGYYPSIALRQYADLRPALKLATRIIQIHTYPPDTPISYDGTFITRRETIIAACAIGYSDGFPRLLSNKGYFAVNGQKSPIVGRVCMDVTMLDITDIRGTVKVGDEVFIFDNDIVTLEDIASECGTIGYEIISAINASVSRVSN
ncbi:MAG: alanine racemase [Oscillospiraceae bacterium]|jgi:alanine racemase|nr:alanine racemase [Oscillospiraceae bacterium]